MKRGMKRKVDVSVGVAAVREYLQAGQDTPRSTLLMAVRFTLEELAARFPGQSVEVRVPPAGAVQVFEGTRHRRGTPPAVVEMGMVIWLQLACGQLTWSAAIEQGLVAASGERTNLEEVFPLVESSLL